MFNDPRRTGESFGKKCMSIFGEDIVRAAVSSKTYDKKDPYDVFRLYDEDAFESEKFNVGDRVRLHSLQSATGKRLNGVSSSDLRSSLLNSLSQMP